MLGASGFCSNGPPMGEAIPGAALHVGKAVREQKGEEAPLAAGAVTCYTDARASEEDACIGGYLAISPDLKKCPWFSFQVDETMAPWLRKRGNNPKRMIPALELLATLVAVKLWGTRVGGGMTACLKAFTV